MQQSELPEGWAWVKFEDIVQNYDGKRIPLKSDDRKKRQGEYSYYGASGVIDYIDDYIFDGEYLLISEDGANLVARSTPIAFIAKGQFWVNNHAHIVKTKGNIPLEYLSYFFNSLDLLPFITGSAQPKLTQSNLNNIEISLPPLPEQHRIVTAIEALFSRLDATNERLDRVPGIMKTFRQAVLAAACDGRLTEDWREENPDTAYVANEIEKLITSRKQKYEKQCIEAKKQGKKKPAVLFDFNMPHIESNFERELPKTWSITTVGFVGHVTKLAGFEYTKYFVLKDEGDIPVIRAQNVQMGHFNPINLKYISKETSGFLERSQIHGNELLIVYVGAGTGNVCLSPSDGCWHLSSNVGKITPDWASRKYLMYFLQSDLGVQSVLQKSKATAQPSLSMEAIRQVVLPLPPLPEQQEIVRRVDALFAFADSIEAKVAVAREKTERLRQSILAKAFSGELVPTEAELARQESREYESAEVLLERIKAGGKSGKK